MKILFTLCLKFKAFNLVYDASFRHFSVLNNKDFFLSQKTIRASMK